VPYNDGFNFPKKCVLTGYGTSSRHTEGGLGFIVMNMNRALPWSG